MNIKEDFLKKISLVDMLLHTNRINLHSYLRSYAQRLDFYDLIKEISNIKVIMVSVIIFSLITYFFVHNFLLTILFVLIICLLFNYLIIFLKDKLKPDEDYYDTIDYYNEEYVDLMNLRNTYVYLYSYLVNGEKAILWNIKKRINRTPYYAYQKCEEKIWLRQDVVAWNLFRQIKQQEIYMINDIKLDIEGKLLYLEDDTSKDILNNILDNLTFKEISI